MVSVGDGVGVGVAVKGTHRPRYRRRCLGPSLAALVGGGRRAIGAAGVDGRAAARTACVWVVPGALKASGSRFALWP